MTQLGSKILKHDHEEELLDVSYADLDQSLAIDDDLELRVSSLKRIFPKRRNRLVFKQGMCNITHGNVKQRRKRFIADIFTTLVDIQWRYNLLLFTTGFVSSWLFFALIWLLIAWAHSDLANVAVENWQPCVEEVNGFASALLFSIETQHTIGYGSRHITPKCPEAILLMMIQCCFGVVVQALMTGIVFAKLGRPKKRAQTLLFSKNAVICKRDGQYCLLFRVGDLRKSHLVEAHIRAILIQRRLTSENEAMPLYQFELKVGDEGGEQRLFLVWPVQIEHRIDEDSPFWNISAQSLLEQQFELIVVLEGIVESTGMTAQVRTSYLPREILWGQKFEMLLSYDTEMNSYHVDYSKFHHTVEVDMPRCSAKELAANCAAIQQQD